MTNDNYYSSNTWGNIRQERLEIDKQRCRLCGRTEDLSSGVWLEVHHGYDGTDQYKYRSFGGDENIKDDLTVLCNDSSGTGCHDAITNIIRRRRYSARLHEVKPIANDDRTVKRIKQNVKGTSLSVDRIKPVDNAQRGLSKPFQ